MRFTNLYHKLYGKLVLKNNRGNFSFSVQLTNKSSTEPVTSSVCTYINDKPVVYASFMFQNSKASSIDLSNFNTSNVTNMSYMFNATTKLVGGAGTKYNGSYVDKTYARVDGGTNSPGYFTLKTN